MINRVYDDRLQEPASAPQASQQYGWFKFKPECLQVLNRMQWYLAVLFIARCLHTGVGDGLIGVIISTIERRFGLSSAQSSWIVGVYDLSALFTVLLFTSLGSRYHRPKVLAVGTFFIGAGCFSFLLPHVVLPEYKPAGVGIQDQFTCGRQSNLSDCAVDENNISFSITLSGTKAALAVLILSRMLMGGGYPCLNIQAVTYMDDFTTKGNFALFSGILGAAGLIGPTLAYVCGSLTLKLYTYFYSVNSEELAINTTDSRWVGAWWLGFAAAGVACEIVAFFFLGFPRELPVPVEVTAHNRETDVGDTMEVNSNHVDKKVKTYLWQKQLAKSAQFWGIQVFNFFMKLVANGLAAYGPKYIETQFNLDPADAGLIAGAVLVPGGTIGFLAGGAIIKKWKLKCKGILRLQTLFTLPLPFLYVILIFNCKSKEFTGAPVSHRNPWLLPLDGINMTEAMICESCQCDDIPFTPVCGNDNIDYYSPCHAGCLSVGTLENGDTYFGNCTCLTGNLTEEMTAKHGACIGNACYLLPAFLSVACVIFILSCAAASMYQVALMRVIIPKERSDALGISAAALCIGGMVGPLFFGFVFDDACDLWDYHCGERGVCLTYNRERLGYNLFYLSMTASIVSVIGSAVAWYTFKAPVGSDEEVEERTRDSQGNAEGNGHKPSSSSSPIYRKGSQEEEINVDIDQNGTMTQLLKDDDVHMQEDVTC